jgi:hypothetical protein
MGWIAEWRLFIHFCSGRAMSERRLSDVRVFPPFAEKERMGRPVCFLLFEFLRPGRPLSGAGFPPT